MLERTWMRSSNSRSDNLKSKACPAFDKLRSGNHRWRGNQTGIGLGRQPIIQPIPGRSSLIDKGNLLIREVLADIMQQRLRFMRHVQRSDKSLMIRKRHRHTLFAHVQSGKDIVVPWYKQLASHRTPPLSMVLSNRTFTTRRSGVRLDIHHTSLNSFQASPGELQRGKLLAP